MYNKYTFFECKKQWDVVYIHLNGLESVVLLLFPRGARKTQYVLWPPERLGSLEPFIKELEWISTDEGGQDFYFLYGENMLKEFPTICYNLQIFLEVLTQFCTDTDLNRASDVQVLGTESEILCFRTNR